MVDRLADLDSAEQVLDSRPLFRWIEGGAGPYPVAQRWKRW